MGLLDGRRIPWLLVLALALVVVGSLAAMVFSETPDLLLGYRAGLLLLLPACVLGLLQGAVALRLLWRERPPTFPEGHRLAGLFERLGVAVLSTWQAIPLSGALALAALLLSLSHPSLPTGRPPGATLAWEPLLSSLDLLGSFWNLLFWLGLWALVVTLFLWHPRRKGLALCWALLSLAALVAGWRWNSPFQLISLKNGLVALALSSALLFYLGLIFRWFWREGRLLPGLRRAFFLLCPLVLAGALLLLLWPLPLPLQLISKGVVLFLLVAFVASSLWGVVEGLSFLHQTRDRSLMGWTRQGSEPSLVGFAGCIYGLVSPVSVLLAFGGWLYFGGPPYGEPLTRLILPLFLLGGAAFGQITGSMILWRIYRRGTGEGGRLRLLLRPLFFFFLVLFPLVLPTLALILHGTRLLL